MYLAVITDYFTTVRAIYFSLSHYCIVTPIIITPLSRVAHLRNTDKSKLHVASRIGIRSRYRPSYLSV